MFKQLFVLFLVAMMFGSSMQQLGDLGRFGGGSGANPAGLVPNPVGGGAPGGSGVPGLSSVPGAGGPQVGAGGNPAGVIVGVAGGVAKQVQGLGGPWGLGK